MRMAHPWLHSVTLPLRRGFVHLICSLFVWHLIESFPCPFSSHLLTSRTVDDIPSLDISISWRASDDFLLKTIFCSW